MLSYGLLLSFLLFLKLLVFHSVLLLSFTSFSFVHSDSSGARSTWQSAMWCLHFSPTFEHLLSTIQVSGERRKHEIFKKTWLWPIPRRRGKRLCEGFQLELGPVNCNNCISIPPGQECSIIPGTEGERPHGAHNLAAHTLSELHNRVDPSCVRSFSFFPTRSSIPAQTTKPRAMPAPPGGEYSECHNWT